MTTRREFLKLAAMTGATFGLNGCGSSSGFVGGAQSSSSSFAQSPILRKFISPLPALGTGIPIANANTVMFPGSDFYNLAAVQFRQLMHPDLPNETTLWGYMDQTTGKNAYLGPIIAAQRGRPVVLRMKNSLPNKALLPIDTTLMGADMGAAANRITVHLHGGFVPWTSDGGPFTWFSPNGSSGATNGSAGPSFLNGVPGAPGQADYYYPNQQSARMLWYHDHAVGITRLNAYSGLASAYLISDSVLASLTSGNSPIVPPITQTIPLVLQDKSFKRFQDEWGQPGDLWYPYEYEGNQGGVTGRWDLGDPSNGFSETGLPQPPSCVPEFFSDTPVINGEAYPYLEVEPRRYRFLLLNASQARFFNLNLFYESMVNFLEPDFTKAGPAFLQIGTEGGILPAPVVLNQPPTLMPQDSEGNVDPDGPKNLLLAPAERADIIIDFSGCRPGDRLILYNDAPAPFPGGDLRNDYYTGDPDRSLIGGALPTKPGQGPNTRTLMEIRVTNLKGAADANNFTTTHNALVSELPTAYQNSHIPFGETDLDVNAPGVTFKVKTLNEDFDGYGRLIQRLGADQFNVDSFGMNYMDTPSEVVHAGETQVWDVYNNTGDTHPIHFHLVNVQVVGRAPFTTVGVPGAAFAPPDANEMGWKETVRMNPGTVTRVIMKFVLPSVPFAVPNSPRLASAYGMNGAEYVWHCHILEHEEHDMMRPLVVLP